MFPGHMPLPQAAPVPVLALGAYLKNAVWRIDAVVPVPMHWRRRLARGTSAADLLAAGIARRLGLQPLRNPSLDVLDHHDGVVHHDPDREHEAE